MIVQLWWWKTTPTVVTSIAHQSPVSTDQQLIYSTFKRSYSTHSWRFSIFYKKDSSFLLLGCVDFLERSIAPSASRQNHVPLCRGIWFMSSAWSFALATQTAPLAVRFFLFAFILWFCFIHCTSCYYAYFWYTIFRRYTTAYSTHRITTSARKAEDRLRQVLHT